MRVVMLPKLLLSMCTIPAFSTILLYQIASASEQPAAKIQNISIDNGGGPYVFTATGTRTSKPACATDDYWAISNPASDNAKAMLATILTASALGRELWIVGTGTCDPVHTTRERVGYIIMKPN